MHGILIAPMRLSKTKSVYGRPIKVPPRASAGASPSAKPTDAEVEAVFDLYAKEVQRLFKSNAARLLPAAVAAKGIKIVRVGVDPDDRS